MRLQKSVQLVKLANLATGKRSANRPAYFHAKSSIFVSKSKIRRTFLTFKNAPCIGKGGRGVRICNPFCTIPYRFSAKLKITSSYKVLQHWRIRVRFRVRVRSKQKNRKEFYTSDCRSDSPTLFHIQGSFLKVTNDNSPMFHYLLGRLMNYR